MGACTAPGELAIVTEFMAQGDVNHLIHSPNSKATVFQKLKMAADVSQGMMWLHQSKPPIIHRDLKPSNLLVRYFPLSETCTLSSSDILDR